MTALVDHYRCSLLVHSTSGLDYCTLLEYFAKWGSLFRRCGGGGSWCRQKATWQQYTFLTDGAVEDPRFYRFWRRDGSFHTHKSDHHTRTHTSGSLQGPGSSSHFLHTHIWANCLSRIVPRTTNIKGIDELWHVLTKLDSFILRTSDNVSRSLGASWGLSTHPARRIRRQQLWPKTEY